MPWFLPYLLNWRCLIRLEGFNNKISPSLSVCFKFLRKSSLWRLGLRGFSNNGLNFSFNCLFTSNILWFELDTWQKIITVGFMLRACRLLLAKGAFHSIRESQICFVLRIIKRNYKLKFSGLTVEKVSLPIIEYTSCICGDEVLPWEDAEGFYWKYSTIQSYKLCGHLIPFNISHSSKVLTFLCHGETFQCIKC